MDVKDTFEEFVSNLKVADQATISKRYKKITKRLNQSYYGSDSNIDHSLMTGSYGRGTAIQGVSDLDMVFWLPWDVYKRFDSYEDNGQSALLQEVKNYIKITYPNTNVKADGQVVVVSFDKYVIDVLPCFEHNDRSFTHPDSNHGGKWKKTNPRTEIKAVNTLNTANNGNLKYLAMMVRAWKNKVGAPMNGFLIDTLCYNFINSTTNYQSTSFSKYDLMSKVFFDYLRGLNKDQEFWYAPGSNQKAYKKGNFIPKAKKAFNNCTQAIEAQGTSSANKKWKNVYGRNFPASVSAVIENAKSLAYKNTEEHIEDKYQVDVRYGLTIDCSVIQDGFRLETLTNILAKGFPLKTKKDLEFFIADCTVPSPYEVLWKVRNVGDIAERKDMIRGSILSSGSDLSRKERTEFYGKHYVECYIIKNGVCVARDKLDVPISSA